MDESAKKRFFKKNFSNQKGQTAVEYILLLAVVASMMTVLLRSVKGYLLADNGDCTGPKAQTAIICQVQKLWGEDPNFRYFTLRGH